ncbi:hypothetical protein METP3_02192 [Methanosarcinales archaeon]|nr:hypothetical protein METP3_02192 [Methanosarcinales archaeon]
MEKTTNDTQDLIEKAIWKFLEQNRELILRRLLGDRDLDIQTDKIRQRMTDDGGGKIVFERL